MNINEKKSSYLVVLAGLPRGGNQTWKTLEKFVLKELNADLAIFWNQDWDSKLDIYHMAKYKWYFEEYSDFKKYYIDNFKGNWEKYFATGIDINGKETGLEKSGLIHFVFKDLVLKNYLDVIKEYDFIIYSRFDQFYLDYHPEVNDSQIMIPFGEDFYGICDRHAAFPTKFAENFFSICNFIDSEKSLKNIPKFNNCETTFLQHLQSNNLIENVYRFQRAQFTSSLKGEKTNWRIPKYKLYFYNKLMIKYPDEFISGVKNCINRYTLKKYFIFNIRICLNYFYLLILRKIGNYDRENEFEFF